MGDPAGIGPEVIGKAWANRHHAALKPFFAVGDVAAFAPHWNGPAVQISDPTECAAMFDTALPVVNVSQCGDVTPGAPDAIGARCAFQALEMAVGFARNGNAGAVVTGPVSKAQLYDVGFTHPGQTEFVAERCGVSTLNATMMLAGPDLRVVPLTTHMALANVRGALTAELIEARLLATQKGLTRNFGIAKPRLALAGYNPHAGENGNLGDEEIALFGPVLEKLRSEGMDVAGPLPADTMFHQAARARYDAAVCAYHDQALIPIKTLYFDSAVNLTLGLPIIRTSPDHGTAFDIAGQNKASPSSMIAALRMASDCAVHRAVYDAQYG